ncbi:MAG: reverse transcriptase family protein [Bacteroidota bacterium]
MGASITRRGLHQRAQRFRNCRSFNELARLLRREPLALLALASKPRYRKFEVPKRNGGWRKIEDPDPTLKATQRRLNDYLQAVYHFHRTPAAYGFLTNAKDDPSPRNILTNAQRHVGNPWMLNVDLKDFFHQVRQPRVRQLFRAPLLDFADDEAKVLAALCCYNGRLPMGAPTSPVITNLVCIPLDGDLQDYATDRSWTYTRYADDLCFSGPEPITDEHLREITAWIEAYGFKINPQKVRRYGPNDENKEVTGILVGPEGVSLPAEYLDALDLAIIKLNEVINAKNATPSGRYTKTPWVTELKQSVRGKLEFARHILPYDDERLIDLEMAHEVAITPPEEYGPLNWLEFGYTLFKHDLL